MTIAELKNIISKFRTIVESDSITPESLGAILQQISDFAAQMPDFSALDGKPGGLPLLDAQAKIKPEVIPAQFKDIPFYNDVRSVGSLMEVPAELPSSGQVVFSESHKSFVFLVGGLYYPDWKDADKWGIASATGRKPYLDKLYFNVIKSQFNVGDPIDGLKLLPIHSMVASLNEWTQSLSSLKEQHDELVEWNKKYGAYEYEVSIAQAEPGDEPAADEGSDEEPAWVVDNPASLIPLVNLLRADKHVNLFAMFPSNVGFSQSSLRIPAQSFYVNGDSYFFSFNVDDNIFILEVSNTAPEHHSITVLRSGLLESIISLETRVDRVAYKELLIKMWDDYCTVKGIKFGGYDRESDSWNLNGLTLSEAEVIQCLNTPKIQLGSDSLKTINYVSITNRTIAPIYIDGEAPITGMFSVSPNLEVIRLLDYYSNASNVDSNPVKVGRTDGFAYHCLKLRRLEGIIQVKSSDNLGQHFHNMYMNRSIEHFMIHGICLNTHIFQSTPVIDFESLRYLVDNAANSAPINVTVHADVFAKMTGDTSNQAAAALQPEEAAQWQKLFNDAADRQISFATA